MYSDGTVTKDQSGWGFTVKQGATINCEDGAAYTVSTPSLTTEVQTVTHAIHRQHMPYLTGLMPLLQKKKKEKK